MIKDVFKFKTNSWHMKMMKFCMGYSYTDFNYICTYFWLSVLNVFLFIPIAIFKAVRFLFRGIADLIESSKDAVDAACDSKAMKWIATKTERLWIDPSFVDQVIANTEAGGKSNKKYRQLWNGLDDDKRDQLYGQYWARKEKIKEAAREVEKINREKRLANAAVIQQKEDAKRAKEQAKRDRIAKMTIVTKKVFKVLIWPILAGALFLIGWGGYAVVTKVYWGWFPTFAIWTGIILGCVAALMMFIWPIIVFHAWVTCKIAGMCIPCERRKAKLKKWFGWLSYIKYLKYVLYIFAPVVYLGRNIIWPFIVACGKGCQLVWSMAVDWKNDNCAPIEWTKPD